MNNNSNTIGKKTTFWKTIKDKITIPTLQRDYIYGAGTEKTEEVLNNMLDTFFHALSTTGQEETLDFVYGSESKAKEFMPLDGQQRLTTLYLLHYYAALKADFSEQKAKDAFDTLSRFSYATRNSTIAFCKQLLINKHTELKEELANANGNNDKVFESYLKDLDEFRGSFLTDPSIMSMLVVLDRIHQRFKDVDLLWEKLVSDDCPINFYKLDFGVFDLSDDLYNKMNSRGKPLTDFEIFKAKMHKQIGTWNKEKADEIAIKMDTSWMQYIWETLGRTQELKSVDPAYMCFLKNLFRCFDYLAGYDKQRFGKLDDGCLVANMKSAYRVKALVNVFDIFSGQTSQIPYEIEGDYISLIKDSIMKDMHVTSMLLLYAIYLGLYYGLAPDEFYYRYRHVRNLINNSTDYVREANMPELLSDVTHVMQGKLLKIDAMKMNDNSWKEEQEKENHRSVWEQFFKYEDIDEINGSLNAFADGLNANSTLTLGDPVFVNKLLERMDKAAYFFNTKDMEEYERRSALLSLGCYAMANKDKNPAYRYFGVIKGSWQNFTGYHRFDERHYLMNIIDHIDRSRDVRAMIGDISKTSPENWRYYAIKYAEQITVAYRSPDYGYLYFTGVDNTHPFDETKGYLDVAILQSSYFSDTNVAWKMMHRILELKCKDTYNLFLENHGASQIILSKVSNDAQLDMQVDGWHLIGISTDDLDAVSISYRLIKPHVDEVLDDDGNVTTPLQLSDCFVSHTQGEDYVDEGQSILEKLSIKYPSLRK